MIANTVHVQSTMTGKDDRYTSSGFEIHEADDVVDLLADGVTNEAISVCKYTSHKIMSAN